MKVLTALRNQAAVMRRSRDAVEGVIAGKWEIFFDEQIADLKQREKSSAGATAEAANETEAACVAGMDDEESHHLAEAAHAAPNGRQHGKGAGR